MFLLVFSFFFRRRKQIFSNAETQRHRGFSFYEHEMREICRRPTDHGEVKKRLALAC